MTLKSWGADGKQFVYFYTGFENPTSAWGYTVPDGMTDMRVDASGKGKGFFFDKLDTAHTVNRHDTTISKLNSVGIQALRTGEHRIKFRFFGGLEDEDFDAFRRKFQALASNDSELRIVLGDYGREAFGDLVRRAEQIGKIVNPPAPERMLAELKDRIRNADAAFSDFRVASCVVTRDGSKFFGVNVENESYPAGICAESGAIAAMVATAGRATIAHVYLYSPQETSNLVPCGLCLQRLSSYADGETTVTSFSGDKVIWSGPFNSLLSVTFAMNP